MGISQGISVWVLDAPHGFGDAGVHAHHAIQITSALTGTLSLASGDAIVTAPTIAVAADAPHKFAAQGLLAFIFVEPESHAGRVLTERLFRHGPLAEVSDAGFVQALEPLRDTFDAPHGSEQLLDFGAAAVRGLVPEARAPLPDARVRKIIDFTAAHLDEPLNLAIAARGVHLSPSRLRHLFVEQTGLPYKTYLLWLRLMRAVQLYAEGRSLTESAHAAGFADSAHFSRAFRRTFGLPATTLTRL
jgi:AraC-like DNA-binding protein